MGALWFLFDTVRGLLILMAVASIVGLIAVVIGGGG